MAKSKGKGKVNEKSLEVLKKSVRAGGRKSTVASAAEKKPATPARQPASRPRSRSRSRTPARSKDVPVAKPKTPTKKKGAPKKKKEAPLKRLDTEKKATTKRAKTSKAKAQPKAKAAPKGKKKAGRTVEALVQKLESSLPNSLSTQTSSTSVGTRGRKSTSPMAAEPENGGWFSKCVIV